MVLLPQRKPNIISYIAASQLMMVRNDIASPISLRRVLENKNVCQARAFDRFYESFRPFNFVCFGGLGASLQNRIFTASAKTPNKEKVFAPTQRHPNQQIV